MNIARSAIAVAVASTLGMTSAHALTQAEYATATKIYFGGATATDNVLEATFLAADGDGICDAVLGNIDVYRAANQRVITCYVSNDNPVTAGRSFPTRAQGGLKIAFHKESAGGSSNGVNPLIAVAKGQAHSLRWLDVGASSCGTATVVPATANRLGYNDYASCSLVQTAADTAGSSTFDVHGGISDNEPALAFPAPGKDATKLTSKAGVQIIFGVPVTTVLYRALQKAQFPAGTCDTVVTQDTEACVPSLEKNQIVALYTQNITSWNDFKDANGIALTAVPGVTAPADDVPRICRRVATSGTQASYEAVLLNQRCVANAQGFAAPDDESTITDTVYKPNQFALGATVNAAPSSGNVRTCFASANTGNFWAVGVLSTEVTDSNYNSGNGGFRFIGINGAAPNLANVANGKYDFFTENTVNYIKSGNPGALVASDNRFKIVDLVSNRLGNVDAINTINADFDGRPWGNGGILALPTVAGSPGTAPYDAAELAASPISTQTRAGNTCQPAIMRKVQPVDNR